MGPALICMLAADTSSCTENVCTVYADQCIISDASIDNAFSDPSLAEMMKMSLKCGTHQENSGCDAASDCSWKVDDDATSDTYGNNTCQLADESSMTIVIKYCTFEANSGTWTSKDISGAASPSPQPSSPASTAIAGDWKIQFFASTDGTCTGIHSDLSSGSVFTSTATANPSCHSYADYTPSFPVTWPTNGKYAKFVCSGSNVVLSGLCSEGCAISTCQETATISIKEVVGKCVDQISTGYPDYKIIEMNANSCDTSSASATASYLTSACTVVAFMLLQTWGFLLS